ncbi:MAG: ribose-5-phosphate isomerase RpiA, partial [Burkholderiales bacterium]
MTQDELKQAVARAALTFVPMGGVIGVGTGSTANFFIAELGKIKHKF